MKILEKSKKIALLIGTVLIGSMAFSKDEVADAVAPQVIDTPIYEQMGLSSTMLFTIMTLFTLLLLVAMINMANSVKSVMKYEPNQSKKTKLPKVILALIGLFATSSSIAAETTVNGAGLIPFPDMVFWGYIVIDIVLIMAIFYFRRMVKDVISQTVELNKPKAKRWKKMNTSLTNSVAIEDEDTILLDHDYDGITELDNLLPPWWKYGFYITIIWAVVYFFYYQVFKIGITQEGEYNAEMAEGERQVAEYKAAHPEMINAENVELLTDAASLSKGKATYEQYCVACHMANGGGGIGANLTDEYWLYGNDVKGIFKTISEGADNGMASWKAIIEPGDIQAISSYILTMDYVAPPTGKDPQGDKK